MKEIVIYGINMQAQQLYYYIRKENCGNVAAFIIDKEYYKETMKEMVDGCDIVFFEDITRKYPPDRYDVILSFGYKNMVRNREKKFCECKKAGYTIKSFISKEANVNTENIGEGVVIYPNVYIAPYTYIGKGTFIEIGCNIAHHTSIDDFVFLAPGVTVCGGVSIQNNCFIGGGSVVGNNVIIEKMSLVGAGVCVTKNLKSNTALCHGKSVELCKEPSHYI